MNEFVELEKQLFSAIEPKKGSYEWKSHRGVNYNKRELIKHE